MDRVLELALSNAATATLLALAVALLTLRLRRPALAYALWLAVLLRLLAPPLLEVGLLPSTADAAGPAGGIGWTGALVAVDPTSVEAPILEPEAVVLGLWLTGAALVMLVGTARSLRFRGLLSNAEPPSRDLAGLVESMSGRLELRRPPRVLTVAERVPPMLWSLFGTTRLILPVGLLRKLSTDETEALLGHELAHLKRRDHWTRHLELMAAVLFWWHPVAWWAVRKIRCCQELCCDHMVTRLLPERRRAYADCLVKTAAFLVGSTHRPMVAASPMADLRELKGRITMIMTETARRTLSLPARAAVALTVLVALAITPVLTARTADLDDMEFTGEPINLVLEEAKLSDVLAQFSGMLPDLEILVEPGVEAEVTANFVETPWDEALHRILIDNGFEYDLEGGLLIVRRGTSPRLQPVEIAEEPRLAGRFEGQDVFRYVESDNWTAPVVTAKVNPRYPEQARKDKVQGAVILEALIDAAGGLRDLSVVESPSDELSRAAIEAVEQWRFEPATLEGEAVTVRYLLTIRFRLE